MSSFQMESLKVMEKFDGGNFHLWKFKMRMMFSKHGHWKFVDASATLLSEEVASADYNEKEMKAFELLCDCRNLSFGLMAKVNVVTLALGSQPRQRGCKGADQEEAQESHHILPGV
jgi:hypothetical protein